MANQQQIDVFASTARLAYRDVYQVFSSFASSEGVSLTPIISDCFKVTKPSAHTTVQVDGQLFIDRLPRKRVAAGKTVPVANRIAVLMSSKEVYGFNDNEPPEVASYLHEAYVSVGYYKVSSKGWKAMLGLRYDFNGRGARHAHPIFHAQMHDGAVDPALSSVAGAVVERLPQHEVYDCVRVPTANMIGPSALLKLAADHLTHDSFSNVFQKVKDVPFFKNWRCNCTTLDDKDSARGLLASGWYGTKS